MVEGQLHVQSGVRTQSGDVQVGIQDLHLAVGLDVAGSDFALALGFNVDGLGGVAVDLRNKSLHVQDDFGNVFFDTRYRRKLMLNAIDLDRCHCYTGKRGEKHPPQAVAQGRAVAALKRLQYKSSVSSVRLNLSRLNYRLFNLYHSIPSYRQPESWLRSFVIPARRRPADRAAT